jgi:hypothetical protein
MSNAIFLPKTPTGSDIFLSIHISYNYSKINDIPRKWFLFISSKIFGAEFENVQNFERRPELNDITHLFY